ncbi:MAG TPA: nucleotidyltransferase family protein [Solirubrobacteraceae bacterium]|jgi:hypothetical protein|nr:nucleotidyltransferase family protein [Solirubrobacteraceae bacterium]
MSPPPVPAVRPIEREAIVLLAGCAPRRRALAARVESLVTACDEDHVLELLRRTRLTALVGRRIVAVAGPGAFPRLALVAGGVAAATRRRNAAHEILQLGILARMTQAGVAAAPLKGPDLARRIHADPGLRLSGDVDVLVDSDRLSDAVAVVETLGYRDVPSTGRPWLTELHRRLEHPSPAMPRVEVHWRAEWYSSRPECGGFAGAALERSHPDPGGQGRRFRPADELALLLLVYARDELVGLRLPADLAAWWDRHGPDVGDGALQEIVEADPPLATPLATAALICGRLVGLPAARLIDLGPAKAPRARLATRLADPFLDQPPRRRASTLVDGLFSSRGTIRSFLRRRVFVPTGHVAATYGCDAGPMLYLLTIQHPVRRAVHYARFVGSPPPRSSHFGLDPGPGDDPSPVVDAITTTR